MSTTNTPTNKVSPLMPRDFPDGGVIIMRGTIIDTMTRPSGRTVYTVENLQYRWRLQDLPQCHGGTLGSPKAGDVVDVSGFLQDGLAEADGIVTEFELINQPTLDMMPISVVPMAARQALTSIALVIRTLKEPDIRAFLDAVFSDPSIYYAFVNAAGGLEWHHAYPGGLLVHTAECVHQTIAEPDYLYANQESREAAIAAAAVHDLSRVDRAGGGYINHAISDELRTMSLIAGPLRALREKQQSIAEFLMFLLDRKSHRPGDHVAEAHMVARNDAVSAARDLANRAFAGTPSWASTATLRVGGREVRVYRAISAETAKKKAMK